MALLDYLNMREVHLNFTFLSHPTCAISYRWIDTARPGGVLRFKARYRWQREPRRSQTFVRRRCHVVAMAPSCLRSRCDESASLCGEPGRCRGGQAGLQTCSCAPRTTTQAARSRAHSITMFTERCVKQWPCRKSTVWHKANVKTVAR